MPITVANWSDKQLDELLDLLKASDYSPLAGFIFENFLAAGNRIMTDTNPQTTLTLVVNGTDGRAIDLRTGVLQVNGLVSHISSTQTINILATTVGQWGTGLAAHATLGRWSLVCIKNNSRRVTPDNRWFVDDSVEPNTYSQQMTNTEREMSYFDIQVVHGTPGNAIESITVPTGYWCIGEVWIPADPTFALPVSSGNIYDTTEISQDLVPHWINAVETHPPPYDNPALYPVSRVLRLEFWSTLFSVDHRTSDGGHKAIGDGGWHIGAAIPANVVTSTAPELNKLTGAGATVTAANLTSLTNGTNVGTMHIHGIGGSGNIIIEDRKPHNTAAQTIHHFTGGLPNGWNLRDLTTITQDDTGAVVLAGDQFTLPNGTYLVEISVPAYSTGVHKAVLAWAIAGTVWPGPPTFAVALTGTTADTSTDDTTCSYIRGRIVVGPGGYNYNGGTITIPTGATFVVEHEAHGGGTGGNKWPMDTSIEEVYTQIHLLKVA